MSGYTKEIQRIIDETYKPKLKGRSTRTTRNTGNAKAKAKGKSKVTVTKSTRNNEPLAKRRRLMEEKEESDEMEEEDDVSCCSSATIGSQDSYSSIEPLEDEMDCDSDILFTTTHPMDAVRQRLRALTDVMPSEHKVHCQSLLAQYERDEGNFSTALGAVEQILAIYEQRSNSVKSAIDCGFSSQAEMVSYLNTVWDTMESSTFGHQYTKNSMIEYLTGRALGINNQQVLGLCGPSGVGKTTLVMNGLSKALGLPFHQVSLGGLKDSTFFNGTARYWKGSHSGIFAKILAEYGPNCVVYLDEVDKIAPENAIEIYGYLTHAFDPITNHNINDNYLGIGLDLSGITFILSFNDAKMLPNPLLDRMNTVYLEDFSEAEKTSVITNYLLPEVLGNFKIPRSLIKINPSTAKYLSEKLAIYEGVRTHKKVLNDIINKILVKLVSDSKSYKALAKKCPNLRMGQGARTTRTKAHKVNKVNNVTRKFASPYKKALQLPYTITKSDIDMSLTN